MKQEYIVIAITENQIGEPYHQSVPAPQNQHREPEGLRKFD